MSDSGGSGTAERWLVLIKHALPTLDPNAPASAWRLSLEGERQSRELARRLRPYRPFRLLSSHEPKAARTAEIVGAEFGIPHTEDAGLREFDRPVLPVLPKAEHAVLNAAIFARPGERVLGAESAEEALARFGAAVRAALAATPGDQHLVAVTHGTVISLFVAAHQPIDGFSLWQRLTCPSIVVLRLPGFEVVEVIESLEGTASIATVRSHTECRN